MRAKYSVVYNNGYGALALIIEMGPHEKRERFWIELSPRATTSDERRQRVLKVLCPGKGSWMMSVGVRVRERKKNDLATWHWKQWQYLKPNLGQSFPLSLCGPNRPISTCPQSLFQSGSKRHIFVMVIRSNFNMNGNCYSYQRLACGLLAVTVTAAWT